MEENQIRENIEDYRFSFKKIFLVFKEDIFGGKKSVENDKISEEVAKIKTQENTSRIQELCDNLENHQTIVKKSKRNTTRSNINRTSEISINKNRTRGQGINKEIGE
mgnify:CR=1 FL=1